MKTNYRLPFDILGIPIKLHISFLIFLPALAWLIGRQIDVYIELLNLGIDAASITQGANAFLIGLFAAVGLFVGVTLHELGHSIVGMRYGVKIESITLYVLGGVAQLDEIPSRPGEEAKMALAGPATSFALGGIFWLLLVGINPAQPIPRFILGYLFYINIAVGIFNLVPALPLDGGRVLRSLLSLRKSHFEATRISTRLSKILAGAMGIYGLLTLNIILLVIAFYIYAGVTTEFQHLVVDRALEGLTTEDLMTEDVVTVDPEVSVFELRDFMMRKRHLGYPVLKDDQLVGIVTLEDLEKTDDPDEPIENILTSEVITIDKEEPASEALHRLVQNDLGRLVVTERSGDMVGIITRTDIMHAMKIVTVSPSELEASS
ncbi:site-2 protease family protein [Candidatus Bipolaricaulota bacterium]|nr:site-2 protease family protein [Candidatus Bipolaricaulota bacterium]MBS3814517.1 site-2 protease family protein [Candidatus Bipolaricaulota bacterium]MBS3825660.1 site-2 protease family protein [Candidatus Bipolaricaulota bacterium]